MKIIEISPRRKSLVALKLSEELDFEFAVREKSGLILIDFAYSCEKCLKEDMEISENELKELILESHSRRAKSKALWLISRKDYSSGGLIKKLGEEFPQFISEQVCDRMIELGLIDDIRFAENLAENLIEIKGVAPRQAPYLMAEKGVEISLAKKIIEQRNDDPKEQIKAIINKKYKNYLIDEKGLQKTFNALIRKGFSYSDIKSVIRDFGEDIEDFGE